MVFDLLDIGFHKLSHTLMGAGYGAKLGSGLGVELEVRCWIAGFLYWHEV